MLPPGKRYRAEIIDTWNMTITPVEALLDHTSTIHLPSRKYMAIRLVAEMD